MVDLKLLASVQHLGDAVQRALVRNEQLSSDEMDQLVDSLTAQVNETVEALDRPGETPVGEDPFDYYTGLINGLTADIAALRQSDIIIGQRAEGLSEALDALTGRVDVLRAQTDPADTTAGALLTVGAFGLGTSGMPLPGNDLNLAIQPGLYRGSGVNTLNGPDGIAIYGTVQVYQRESSVLVQEVTYLNSKCFRSSNDGGVSWFPWNKVFHTNNILGTVSYAGGAPTGAIIERGSNANGEYIRWADGTMICRFDDTVERGVDGPHSGGMYHTVPLPLTFPAMFAENAQVTPLITASINYYAWGVSEGQGSRSNCAIRGISPNNSPLLRLGYVAIGRWR